MKKLVLFVGALLLSSFSFAATTKSGHLNNLATAWKAKQTTGLTPGHDINMVYGGEDMSPRHQLVTSISEA